MKTDEIMKYSPRSRGIERFNEIDANSTPVLFVRTIPTTEELVKVPELLGDTKAYQSFERFNDNEVD